MKGKVILFIFIFFFLFLRLYHLVPSLNFGSDQGFGILEMYRLYQTKQITLIGPSSSFTIQGQYIYVSSLVYYLSLLVLIISGWNPLGISYFIIILQLLSFVFLYKVLRHRFPNSSLPYFFAILYTFSPIMVNYSRFSWAPNYLIPISGVILFLLLKLNRRHKSSLWLPLIIGLFLGIGLQFHYSFFFVILLTFVWLVAFKKHYIFYFKYTLFGLLIGFSPIILFELRHNFHNLKTLIIIFGAQGSINSGTLQLHYFFGLLPFTFFLISYLFNHLFKRRKVLVIMLSCSFILYSLIQILPNPKSGFTMPLEWNYTGILKTRDIILSEKRNEYNIVDLLTGDTRAYALRSLLTLSGSPPKDVTLYPSSSSLFLYTREPIDAILAGSLWEIDSLKPLHVSKKWHIQNGIYLYLLEKESAPSSMVK